MTPVPPFAPVPVRARRDGWTPAVQADFIAALYRTRNVAAACRAVNRSWQSAYRLRARPDAAGFAAAWDAMLAAPCIDTDAIGRAVVGIARPVRYRGRVIGERRRFDTRLGLYILRLRALDRFVTGKARRPAADPAPAPAVDPADRLAHALATLRADLAAGAAPHDGDEFSDDVARMSSPSARRGRPCEIALPVLGRGRPAGDARGGRREGSSSRAVFASARSPPLTAPRMPRSA